MKWKYKPRAIRYSEGNGFFTISCNNKELAQKLMQEVADDYGDGDLKIELENIKVKKGYYCSNCSFTTIDEPMCCECGKQLSPFGRNTFTYDY